jgi:transcriptional regulator with XRE-family HTH domain
MDLIEIGESVKNARRSKGWSQDELASASGASRARIAALENGRAPEFGVKLLSRILAALDLDLRLTTYNASRPTLEDLAEEAEHAPRLGR